MIDINLIYTANEIAKSYNKKLIQDYKEYSKHLACTYYKYKEKLKFESSHFEKNVKKNTKEFHGKRDFYHLIKNFCKILLENNYPTENEYINNILNKSIERNLEEWNIQLKYLKIYLKKIL